MKGETLFLLVMGFFVGIIVAFLVVGWTLPSDYQKQRIICEYEGGERFDGPDGNDSICIRDGRVIEIKETK